MTQIMCNQRDLDFLQNTGTVELLNTACKSSALNSWLGARKFHLMMLDLASGASGSLVTLSCHHFQFKGRNLSTSWTLTNRKKAFWGLLIEHSVLFLWRGLLWFGLLKSSCGFSSCCLALSSSLASRNLNFSLISPVKVKAKPLNFCGFFSL